MDIKAYLKHIGYHGPLDTNAHTLQALQLAHLLSVPFENLSIHANEPILLEDKALFEKIVIRQRGGFCYELNGLFAALLRALGFNVTLLSARVAKDEGIYTPDFDHMTLMVSLNQTWLVDVGFGDIFRHPLHIEDAAVQTEYSRAYRLSRHDESWTLIGHESGEDWKAIYRFEQQPYVYTDFVPMCIYHQTSMESKFRRDRICSLATREGRKSLSNMTYIVTTLDGERYERTLCDEEEYAKVLADEFGIIM